MPVMWLCRLSFFCFMALFSPAPVSAGPVVSVGGWERKEQPDRRYEVIGPRMRGHEPRTIASVLPPYQLPMFRHVQAPLLDMALFRPSVDLRPLPSAVKNLLLPPPDSWLGYPTAPAGNPRGVEVWCGNRTISVRVNRRMLGFWCHPSMMFLGNCEVYRFTRDYFYFHNDLDQCGITPRTIDGQLVYTSILRYVPEPQGPVIRAVPLSLPIHCSYNRFHYSYKVGYVPHLQKASFVKSITMERIFSLVTCNEHWEKLGSTGSYMLGEPMYFEASTAFVSRMERVTVTACHVTVSKDANSMPRMDVIGNFGCMVDSKRFGSQSKFHGYSPGVLRFVVDAFIFPGISSKLLYLHCEMTVADYSATPTAKSCTFNSKTQSHGVKCTLRLCPNQSPIYCALSPGYSALAEVTDERWEELVGSVSTCSCCDSQCGDGAIWPSSLHPTPRSIITSDPWSIRDVVTTGAGGSRQADTGKTEVLGDTMEGKEAEGVGPVTQPIDTEGVGSAAEPVETAEESEGPVQVGGFWGRGRGSPHIKGSGGRPLGAQDKLLEAEGEPAVWREDDQGPDQDDEEEEEEEEDGGLEEEVRDEDGSPSRTVAGKVLESIM